MKKSFFEIALSISVICLLNFAIIPPITADSNPILISANPEGKSGDLSSYNGIMSKDGKYVVFISLATDLVPYDKTKFADIFVRDLDTGTTKQISVSIDDEGTDGGSLTPSISNDGRYIVFASQASNLIPNDNNAASDIFLYDQNSEEIKRISVSNSGTEANARSLNPYVSTDGSTIVFYSKATNLVDGSSGNIYTYDINSSELTSLNISGDCFFCFNPISSDGRYIVFISDDTSLVSEETSENDDIFVYDTQTGQVVYVSPSYDGQQAHEFSDTPSISGNGKFVSFVSDAPNLVADDNNKEQTSLFVRDLGNGITELVSFNEKGEQIIPNFSVSPISEDGNVVGFSSENEIFVHNRLSDTAMKLDVEGEISSISSDGNYILIQTLQSLSSEDTNDESDVYLLEISDSGTAVPIPEPEIEPIPEPEIEPTSEPETEPEPVVEIPDYIKNNAGWWSEGLISDNDFVSGIKFLIENDIMIIPPTESGEETAQEIPDYIKNNAGWWSEGLISDNDFVSGIQWLITNGIMKI